VRARPWLRVFAYTGFAAWLDPPTTPRPHWFDRRTSRGDPPGSTGIGTVDPASPTLGSPLSPPTFRCRSAALSPASLALWAAPSQGGTRAADSAACRTVATMPRQARAIVHPFASGGIACGGSTLRAAEAATPCAGRQQKHRGFRRSCQSPLLVGALQARPPCRVRDRGRAQGALLVRLDQRVFLDGYSPRFPGKPRAP
jgi:hypothetical protein